MNQGHIQLYHYVTEITEEYLGPAAERFIARQVSFHLGKTPDQLDLEDLPQLIDWVSVTLGLLTEDRKLIEEYADKLTNLHYSFPQS